MNKMDNDTEGALLRLDETTRALLHGWIDATRETQADPSLRQRLLDRVARSVRAASVFHTVRGRPDWRGRGGMRERTLYRHDPSRPLRSGEPWRVRLLEIAAGAPFVLPDIPAGTRCEWLVMRGDADVEGVSLSTHDYRVVTAGAGPIALHSGDGALLYLREAPSAEPLPELSLPNTVRAASQSWQCYAPGIERRVLWRHGDEAAMLYRVQPGAAVPGHRHGHDEECLMIEGELFLDDILLRAGEYQLAPAGTGHAGVASDTGGVIYAHGDVDLDLRS